MNYEWNGIKIIPDEKLKENQYIILPNTEPERTNALKVLQAIHEDNLKHDKRI